MRKVIVLAIFVSAIPIGIAGYFLNERIQKDVIRSEKISMSDACVKNSKCSATSVLDCINGAFCEYAYMTVKQSIYCPIQYQWRDAISSVLNSRHFSDDDRKAVNAAMFVGGLAAIGDSPYVISGDLGKFDLPYYVSTHTKNVICEAYIHSSLADSVEHAVKSALELSLNR